MESASLNIKIKTLNNSVVALDINKNMTVLNLKALIEEVITTKFCII